MQETKTLPARAVQSCAIILLLFRNSSFFVHLFRNARMLHQSKALIIRELVRCFLHVSLTWPGGRARSRIRWDQFQMYLGTCRYQVRI